MIARQQPIVKATAIVATFWWVVFTLWHGGFHLRDIVLHAGEMGWGYTIAAGVAAIAGILAGFAITAYSIWFDRRQVQQSLLPRVEQGVSTTLGPVPIHLGDLPRATDGVSVGDIVDVKEIERDGSTDFLQKWHTRFDGRAPQHSKLMFALERMLVAQRALPATHVPGGHGGRSLLVHSLLVCWYMEKLAPNHKYNGEIKLPDFKIKLKLKVAGYQFDSDDPLIAIVGLAHDIGKIECYEYDRDGKLIGCRRDHDLTGSRILARMPEFWDLPDEDRDTLSLVIGHYHHPQDMPTLDGFEVLSDRNHAMLELLIRADVLSSKREAGLGEGAANTELEGDGPFVDTVEGKDLWKAVEAVLARVGAINGRNGAGNIGFKYRDRASDTDLVYLVEKDFIDAVTAEAGVTNTIQELRNDVSAVSKKVLALLHDRGVLYMDRERSPSTALYNVQFYAPKGYWENKEQTVPKAPEDRAAPAFRLGSVIIIRPGTLFPAFGQLTDFDKVPVIGKSRLGTGGVRRPSGGTAGGQRTTITDIALDQELEGGPVTGAEDPAAASARPFDAMGAAREAQQAIDRAKAAAAGSAPPAEEPDQGQPADPADEGTPWDEDAGAGGAEDDAYPWDESAEGTDVDETPPPAPDETVPSDEEPESSTEDSPEGAEPAAPAPLRSPKTLGKAVRSMLWTGISNGQLMHREISAADDTPGQLVMCRVADVKTYMDARGKLTFSFEDMDQAVREGFVQGVQIVGVCYQVARDVKPR